MKVMTSTPSSADHRTSVTPAASGVKGPCYRVWAPNADRITLEVNGRRTPMASRHDGWWVSGQRMTHGDSYGFIVDEQGPFPDPRSMYQPSGVHGASEVIDHSRFVWSDARWQAPPLGAGVLYELHIGTFTREGTFAAAIDKLPYLAGLGITHLELMPVAEFPGDRGWGYDGVDLFAPHHVYGRPDDLKRLVDACHAHGLAVILDVVYNHLGPAGNYLSRFGPYFTHRYHTPWGDAVNLDNAGSDEVRRFFCDNAVMWLRDYHFDGLRIDAVHALIDTSARHFLEQLAGEVDTLEAITGRHLVLIAESDLNDPRVIRSREGGGYGLDAQWSDDFHHALHGMLTGERTGYYEDFGTMAHFARALQEAFVYGGTASPHRRRTHGRMPAGLPGWRFVVAAQNHDQIGNRATGDRLTHLVSRQRLKIAAALLLTAPFVPMLFQGEEWGASSPFQYFTSHEDEALGRLVSEGRRREFAAFGWDPGSIPDPQMEETYRRSQLRWDEPALAHHAELLRWYRDLLALRRDHPALRDGKYRSVRVTCDEQRGQLTIQRGAILIVCSLAGSAATIETGDRWQLLLTSEPGTRIDQGRIHLPAESIAVCDRLGPEHDRQEADNAS